MDASYLLVSICQPSTYVRTPTSWHEVKMNGSELMTSYQLERNTVKDELSAADRIWKYGGRWGEHEDLNLGAVLFLDKSTRMNLMALKLRDNWFCIDVLSEQPQLCRDCFAFSFHTYFEMFANAACSICTDQFDHDKAVAAMPCGHTFHDECLGKWLANTRNCPSCRKPLKKNQHAIHRVRLLPVW